MARRVALLSLPWLLSLVAMVSMILLLFVLTTSTTACGADEDTVEGKACEYGSNDPDLQCVQGYHCVPHPDGDRCEPDE